MSNPDGLFPELTSIMDAFDALPNSDQLSQSPEHSGLTAEQVDAFFQANPGIRTLQPLVSNQQPVGGPFTAGTGAPPPVGGIEGANGGIQQGTENQPSPAQVPPPSFQPPAPQYQTPPPVQQQPGAPAQGIPSQQAPQPSQQPVPLNDAELRQLQALREQLRTDPELTAKIRDHLVGRVVPQGAGPSAAPPAPPVQPLQVPPPSSFQPASTPAPPFQTSTPPGAVTPPDDLDLDDPTIKFLWDTIQGQASQITQMGQQVQTTQQVASANQQQQVNDLYTQARSAFQQKYELEQQDVDKLDGIATRLGVLPQLLSGTDPMTGLPVRPDIIAAVDRALEIAYFTDDTYRQREWERQGKQRRTDAQRQQRLAAVSGSPASVPRSTPAPTTQEGRQQAMLAEVGQMLNGSWSEPTPN